MKIELTNRCTVHYQDEKLLLELKFLGFNNAQIKLILQYLAKSGKYGGGSRRLH